MNWKKQIHEIDWLKTPVDRDELRRMGGESFLILVGEGVHRRWVVATYPHMSCGYMEVGYGFSGVSYKFKLSDIHEIGRLALSVTEGNPEASRKVNDLLLGKQQVPPVVETIRVDLEADERAKRCQDEWDTRTIEGLNKRIKALEEKVARLDNRFFPIGGER